jgi:hypothetical protein
LKGLLQKDMDLLLQGDDDVLRRLLSMDNARYSARDITKNDESPASVAHWRFVDFFLPHKHQQKSEAISIASLVLFTNPKSFFPETVMLTK